MNQVQASVPQSLRMIRADDITPAPIPGPLVDKVAPLKRIPTCPNNVQMQLMMQKERGWLC